MTKALTVVERAMSAKEPTRLTLYEALQMLDLRGGPSEIAADAAISDKFLQLARDMESMGKLDQAYVIWRLCKPVEAQVWEHGEEVQVTIPRWVTWESDLYVRWKEDPKREWEAFCLRRLGMDANTAYQRRRVWELYAETLGYDRSKLERAGISKLQRARAQVARDWEAGGVDDILINMLMGVTYDESGEDSPDGETYKHPPATDDTLVEYLRERRQGQSRQGDSIHFRFEMNNGSDRVTCWVTRPGDPVSVPVDLAVVKRIGYASIDAELSEDEWEQAWDSFVKEWKK